MISTQCWINTYFLIFFFFGLFHFPDRLYSKGDQRFWDNISIGRGESELLEWSECLFYFQGQMPPSTAYLPKRTQAKLYEAEAFQSLDTIWLSITPHVTSKLYFCVCHSCAGHALSMGPFKLLPKSARTQSSVQLESHPLWAKKLLAQFMLKIPWFQEQIFFQSLPSCGWKTFWLSSRVLPFISASGGFERIFLLQFSGTL